MAAIFTRTAKRSDGARYIISGDLALDNAYPAGGYVLTAAQFGHRNSVTHIETGVSTNGFVCEFVPATSKLKFYKGAVGALLEVGSTDLNGDSIRLHVTGK